MGPEFFHTPMGHRFYEGTMPRVAEALERLAQRKERSTWVQACDGGLVNLDHCSMIGMIEAMEGKGWFVYATMQGEDRRRIQLTKPMEFGQAKAFLNTLGAHLGALMETEGL